ncbi:excinuclease, partial [Vibrio anguillarum]|nr:excinuclease [Vibrio anguillarum]
LPTRGDFMQNCSSVFTVCFLSSAVRCQPLSRAL